MFNYIINRVQAGRCINIINARLKDKDLDKDLKKKLEDYKEELLFVYTKTNLSIIYVDFEFVKIFYKVFKNL